MVTIQEQNPLQTFCNWITRMAWVNFLVIFFSLLSLILFGLTASLATGVHAMKAYLSGKYRFTVSDFYQHFKLRLRVSSMLGASILLTLFSMGWYAMHLVMQENKLLIAVGFSLLPLLVILSLIYISLISLDIEHYNGNRMALKKAIVVLVKSFYIPVGFVVSLFVFLGVYSIYPITGAIFFIAPTLLTTSVLYNFKYIEE
ncbi:DUF624 domain-containing protein [Vibrio sp. F13]|uniref:DUF624 domain-containing protein n=1 Tax=Vibrio sp. F13 TaxID=2070777 RepID=UPI0010BDE53B|nr:DUF624 domain-containing protein [Vibrio sp. F13]TKF54658.1 DUF624 domain-containing protein [Vibrio sp. F13]